MPDANAAEAVPAAALADVVAASEGDPLVEALVAVGEPMSAEHRSAAWAVVPMDCHVVGEGPPEALGPTECLHQFPTDVLERQWPLADDLADRLAAVPAWPSLEWASPEAQTA